MCDTILCTYLFNQFLSRVSNQTRQGPVCLLMGCEANLRNFVAPLNDTSLEGV